MRKIKSVYFNEYYNMTQKRVIKPILKPSYYVWIIYIYIYIYVTCLKEYDGVTICNFEKKT